MNRPIWTNDPPTTTLSLNAQRWAAGQDEIYTEDQARRVIEKNEHVIVSEGVSLARSALASQRNSMDFMRESQRIKAAEAAVEYANWRLEAITCGYKRVYYPPRDVSQLRPIPRHIRDRMVRMIQGCNAAFCEQARSMPPGEAQRARLRFYETQLPFDLYTREHTRVCIYFLTNYANVFTRDAAFTVASATALEYAFDHRAEILALCDWLTVLGCVARNG